MMIKVGVDLVKISRFQKMAQKRTFLERVFLPIELRNATPESLAGIFAVKEAVFKALDKKAGQWHKIEVKKLKSGKPQLLLAEDFKKGYKDIEVSIAHENDLAVAVVIMAS